MRGYSSNWGFSRQRPKAYKFRPLFNTSKICNTIFTREGMADTKSRTPPSSAHQIYGKVPAKLFNTLFCKSTGRRKQDNERFSKIWGKLTWKMGTCACITFWKNVETQIARSIMHRQKKLDSQYASNVCTLLLPGVD